LIPPQVPLDEGRGRSWGDGGGSSSARAATTQEAAAEQRRRTFSSAGVSADDVTACLARRTSRCSPIKSAARLRAWRVCRVTCWPSAGSSQCCERSAGQVVMRARSRIREGIRPAVPGHGKGRLQRVAPLKRREISPHEGGGVYA